jgi:predicted DNA-binding protein
MRPSPYDKAFKIRFAPAIAERARQLAEARGTTFSEIVRQAVRRELEDAA